MNTCCRSKTEAQRTLCSPGPGLRVVAKALLALTLLVSFAGPADARLFNVKGRILYQDGDPSSVALQLNNARRIPARMLKVMVYEGGSERADGHTDSQGHFSVQVSFANNTPLEVYLEGANAIVRIYADMDCVNESVVIGPRPFNAGTSGDVPLGDILVPATYTSVEVGECAGMTENYDISPSGIANINQVIVTTWSDIEGNRLLSADGDSIGQVEVEYCDEIWNQYNNVSGNITLTCNGDSNPGWDYGFVDATIAHEYTHHVTREISSWDCCGGDHSFCTEIDQTSGDDGELAWSEGFADYMGIHVVSNEPAAQELSGDGDGLCEDGEICSTHMTTTKLSDAEDACLNYTPTTSGVDRFYAVEGHIAATLWDLADGLGRGADAWDVVDGIVIDGHRKTIRIFDEELDKGSSIFADAPDLRDFYEAWVDRQGTTSLVSGQPAIDLILNRLQLVPYELVPLSPGSQVLVPANKMPPVGFIEANPQLPWSVEPAPAPGGDGDGECESGEFCAPGMTSRYDASSNDLTLELDYSYSDAWGSLGNLAVPINLALGVSNLGTGTMGIHQMTGSGNQADAASFDATSVSYTGSGTGWLAISLQGGGAASGNLTAGQLSTIRLALNGTSLIGLASGSHEASVDVDFTITPLSGSALTQSRTLTVEVLVRDAAADDPDSDGLTSRREVVTLPSSNPSLYLCLDPRDHDSDDDGVWDGTEVDYTPCCMNPCDEDTDGDGTPDDVELDHACLDPLNADAADTDGDGLLNESETFPATGSLIYGTDPCKGDTDGDGVSDGSLDPDGSGPIKAGPDNCPVTANADQKDTNGNGIGDVCELNQELSDWLKGVTLPDPGTFLPGCGGGCAPMPPWMGGFPWDLPGRLAFDLNGVLPVPGGLGNDAIKLDGQPRVYTLGSSEAGTLNVQLDVRELPGSAGGGATTGGAGAEEEAAGVHALLLDAEGNELWRIEGETDVASLVIPVEAGHSYVLIINGPPGTVVSIEIGLPGAGSPVPIGLAPGFNLLAIPFAGGSTSHGLMDLLGDASQIASLQWLDEEGGLSEVHRDSAGRARGENVLLGVARGVVVYAGEGRALSFAGDTACAPLDLRRGVNLTGLPCAPEGRTAFQILDALGEPDAASLQRFDPITGRFESAAWWMGEIVGSDFPIQAGEAYYLFMRNDVAGYLP